MLLRYVAFITALTQLVQACLRCIFKKEMPV